MYKTQKLTEDELLNISNQYYELTDELEIYRKHMRGRKYIRTYTQGERDKHMAQYRFLLMAIRESVHTLFAHGKSDRQMLKHVIFNRFIDLKTRWSAVKKLYLYIFGFTDNIK